MRHDIAAIAVLAAPIAHGIQNWKQRFSMLGDSVFNLNRGSRDHLSLNDSIRFQLFQLCGQRFFGAASR